MRSSPFEIAIGFSVDDGRVTVSIVVIAIATCVQVADYLNSGKPITANSLVQKPVMGKLLQFPSIKKSRKAVRVGVAPKKVARVLAMAA